MYNSPEMAVVRSLTQSGYNALFLTKSFDRATLKAGRITSRVCRRSPTSAFKVHLLHWIAVSMGKQSFTVL